MSISGILAQLIEERRRLDEAIAALEGLGRGKRRSRRRRTMSAAARRRISEAMKAKWAERRKKAKAA